MGMETTRYSEYLAECDVCGNVKVLYSNEDNIKNSDFARTRFRELGWSLNNKNQMRCPECRKLGRFCKEDL